MNREQVRAEKEGFTPKGSSPRAPLPFMMRPANDSNFAVFASEAGDFEAYVHHAVLATIDAELVRAMPLETIGLLAGRVMRDPQGSFTLVLACEDARGDETDATPGHVRITAAGHAKLRRRLEATAYGLDLVGWYHSHPSFPARFSSVDTTEQSTLKDQNHLGIVASGIDDLRPYGVYRGPAASPLVPQTIVRRTIPSSSPKLDASSNQIAPQSSVPVQRVSSRPIVTYERKEHSTERNSPISTTQFQENVSRRRVLLAASALSLFMILIWTNYRIYSLENKLGALADLKPTAKADVHTEDSASPSVDNSKAAENPALTLANEKSIASLDSPSNPKLPVANSPDTSKKKKARVGSNYPRNTKKSSGSVGAPAVKQGAVRRSAMRSPTPKPIPMPTIKPLPKPLPQP